MSKRTLAISAVLVALTGLNLYLLLRHGGPPAERELPPPGSTFSPDTGEEPPGGWPPRNEQESTIALHEESKLFDKLEPLKAALTPPEQVYGALGVTGGMKILDFGAGKGFFAVPFAAASQGTATVFATDLNEEYVDLMRKLAHEQGLDNLKPVLVGRSGRDPFYALHEFDIVFMSNVLFFLRHPKESLQQLSETMKPGSGRLFLLQCKPWPDFHSLDLGPEGNAIRTLPKLGRDHPVLLQGFDEATREQFKQWGDKPETPELRQTIVDGLNGLLLDRTLPDALVNHSMNANPEFPPFEWSPYLFMDLEPFHLELVKWLYTRLDAAGVFTDLERPLTEGEEQQLRRLNKILITSSFHLPFDETTGLVRGEGTELIVPLRASLLADMESAGFRLVAEHDFLPHHYLLEFDHPG